MGVFDLDVRGQQQLDERARQNPATLDNLQAGFFDHPLKGIGMGVMRGGAEAFDALGTLGKFFDEPGVDYTPADQLQDEIHKNSVDYWTPRAAEVGTAGRVLGGLGEIVLPLAATGGNPALMIGTQVNKTGKALVDQGVDANTAVAAATTEGLATAVGFKLPFLGPNLATRLASGAFGNLALGAGTTAAERAVLKAGGYDELAQQYDPLDVQSRAVDVLTGLAFGTIAHVQMRPSDVAAVAAANNAKHFQQDTAPGRPADLSAEVAHQDAMEQAIEQLMRGEPVAVPAAVDEAKFTARPRNDARAQALEEAYPPGHESEASLVPRSKKPLSPEDRAIETRFAEQISSDVDAAIDAYSKIKEAKSGKVLNTDIARELSPDYLTDRTRSAAVHEPASALVKEMYARKLAEAPAGGERPLVVISAGGTGAGKSSGLDLVPAVNEAQIVYDTNANKTTSTVAKIDQALAAGKEVVVVYTYREPTEALTSGALTRAMRQEAEHGTGRTVPIDEHVNTHLGSRETIEQIAAHYAGDPRVEIRAIGNSHGKGQQRPVALRDIPKFGEGAYNSVREQALKALEAERAAGRISESVYRGFLDQAGAAGELRRSPDGADRGQPAQANGERADPLVTAVEQSLDQSDVQIPTGEIDADGNAMSASARDIMAEADAQIADAKSIGRGILAAVTCFMQRG